MIPLQITAYNIAQRFIGVSEVKGALDNPLILAMLKLDGDWPTHDEVPWCSAFVNWICWLLRLPRSKSLLARSWLTVGQPIHLGQAITGFDVVILQRGPKPQPGPDVISAAGHVGLYAHHENDVVWVLGGNQGDAVNVSRYQIADVLGVRRLA